MWIEQHNTFCRVLRANEDERAWLYNYLSFDDDTAKYRRAQDNKFRMYSLTTGAFPTGFLPLVQRAATNDGLSIEIADKRTKPCERDKSADLSWLRDYQLEAVNAAINKERGLLWLSTGGGKTELAIALTKALPCKWLFLVHKTSLVHQAAERYELRTGEKAGVIGEGKWSEKKFTCASFQTLNARFKNKETQQLLQSAEGIIVDECHNVAASTLYRVTMATKNAYYRYGLSGTPLARGDQKSVLIVGALGHVAYRLKPEVLIDAGVLARPSIRFFPVRQTTQRNTWAGVYDECIVNSTPRNTAVASLAQKAAKPCMVFVKEIKHGKILLDMLRKAGAQVEFVWGSNNTEQRQAAVKRLVRSDTDILICSTIFNEGVDIPSLASVVIASGGKSTIAAIQRVGRAMRRTEDKTNFEVYEISDMGNYFLEKHSRERAKAYMNEGYETITDIC